MLPVHHQVLAVTIQTFHYTMLILICRFSDCLVIMSKTAMTKK